MSEKKYTPGPWEKDYNGSLGHIKSLGVKDVGTGYKRTPTVARFDDVAPSIPIEEREANARLIACDPELLEALEMALEWIDAVPMDTPLPAIPGFDRDIVDELIAKAKGETK